jgi:hypothetical protein
MGAAMGPVVGGCDSAFNRFHLWLVVPPPGLHSLVWDVAALTALAAMERGRQRMYGTLLGTRSRLSLARGWLPLLSRSSRTSGPASPRSHHWVCPHGIWGQSRPLTLFWAVERLWYPVLASAGTCLCGLPRVGGWSRLPMRGWLHWHVDLPCVACGASGRGFFFGGGWPA